jgi:hypothetical protein
VEVEDGLSGAGADVEDGAVSLLDVALAGDVGGGEVTAADYFGVRGLGLFESSKMFFGDDKDVSGSLRVDVFEGEDVVIVVNLLGGDFAGDDAAEEAVGIGRFWITRVHLGNDSIAAAGLSGGSGPQRLKAANPLGLLWPTDSRALRGSLWPNESQRHAGGGARATRALVEPDQKDGASGGLGFGG